MSKPQHVKIGRCPVPIVPVKDFKTLKKSELEMAWQIVGPSADKNLATSPLWKVIAAAYCEGLHHGAEIMRTEKAHNVQLTSRPDAAERTE